MGEFVKVATASEIPPGEMTIVDLHGQEIAIANLNGEFVAFQNECTHRGGPLGEGILMGDVVECPFHGDQLGPPIQEKYSSRSGSLSLRSNRKTRPTTRLNTAASVPAPT